MTLSILAVIAGFVLLVLAGDRFVTGAAALARNLGVAPLIIGLTIVAFGTSAPEMAVSATAAWVGNPGLAIGNAIGSNIANIGLVLGLTALIQPLHVHSNTLRREFPVLFAITLLTLALLLDGELGRFDGAVLIAGLGLMIYWMVSIGRASRISDPMTAEYAEELPRGMPTATALLWLALGLVLLPLSSRLLVWGAVNIATGFGVSDHVVGLTVVAIGTSLPELAASVAGALKREHDIALGNILGSNMWNLLAVLGLPGLIQPSLLEPAVMIRDFPVMLIFTVALFAMAYGFRDGSRLTRFEGGLLFAGFAGYMATLVLTAA